MTTETLSMTLPADLVRGLEEAAYIINHEPHHEIDVLRVLLDALPLPQRGEYGGPVDQDFLLYALRHLLQSLMDNRMRDTDVYIAWRRDALLDLPVTRLRVVSTDG
jgi:hypothetical protein